MSNSDGSQWTPDDPQLVTVLESIGWVAPTKKADSVQGIYDIPLLALGKQQHFHSGRVFCRNIT